MAIPIPSLQEIVDLIKKGADLEAQEKIMELCDACVSFREESLALRERVKELEQKLSQKDKVIFETGTYWVEGQEIRDGPYCPACYDSNDKLIRLQHWPESDDGMVSERYLCPICKFQQLV